MQIFGLTITRKKNTDLVTHLPAVSGPSAWFGGGWWPRIRESFSGAWQRGASAGVEDVLAHSTAWSCITLIASDIAKLRIKLVEEDAEGICDEVVNPAYSPVLRRPNHYQNRIQFIKSWIISKLTRGNTYVLKERDARNVVRKMHILDPSRVTPLVAPDGSVFYRLAADNLAGLDQAAVVPASEIIHDIYIAPYHPLCGVSPIYACGLAVSQGLQILANASKLFKNGSAPSGVLTAPASISQAVAERVQKNWDEHFAGEDNVGKVAVLGDGLKFEPMAMTAVDSQLIEQLNWGDAKVCGAYHVPPFMAGVGPMPTYTNIEALSQQYYSQCLQELIESLELCLDEGLSISAPLETELDLDALLRMDSATRMKFATDGVRGSVLSVNDARKLFNKKPVPGGGSIYMQQQNYSLEALAARDKDNPAPSSVSPPPAPPKDDADEPLSEDAKAFLLAEFLEELKAA